MSRIKRGTITKKRHKKIIKLAKGYRGTRKNVYSHALEAVMKAGLHAYRDRRKKKRSFRQLWIVRMNAALRQEGISYSKFIPMLKAKNIILDRKSLASLAATHPDAFKAVVAATK